MWRWLRCPQRLATSLFCTREMSFVDLPRWPFAVRGLAGVGVVGAARDAIPFCILRRSSRPYAVLHLFLSYGRRDGKKMHGILHLHMHSDRHSWMEAIRSRANDVRGGWLIFQSRLRRLFYFVS